MAKNDSQVRLVYIKKNIKPQSQRNQYSTCNQVFISLAGRYLLSLVEQSREEPEDTGGATFVVNYLADIMRIEFVSKSKF